MELESHARGFFAHRDMDIAIFFSQEDNDEQLKQIEAHFENRRK